jgi:hypothetical protein
MKTRILAIALTLIGAPALAQSELDRLEAASVSAGENLEAFLVSRVPEIAPAIPDWAWDEDMRAAAVCTLDAIRAEGGDAAVEGYLDEMEVFAEIEITSMEQVAAITPVPINTDFAMRTGQACGTAEIAMRRMRDSGLMEAMMAPDVMGRLMN